MSREYHIYLKTYGQTSHFFKGLQDLNSRGKFNCKFKSYSGLMAYLWHLQHKFTAPRAQKVLISLYANKDP